VILQHQRMPPVFFISVMHQLLFCAWEEEEEEEMAPRERHVSKHCQAYPELYLCMGSAQHAMRRHDPNGQSSEKKAY
jgi:hypothetical protein